MSSNKNGGGGGCIIVTIGDVKHTYAIERTVEDVIRPIGFAFDLPETQHAHGTNGGGGGCIRVKIGGVEHKIAYDPADTIELNFDFN